MRLKEKYNKDQGNLVANRDVIIYCVRSYTEFSCTWKYSRWFSQLNWTSEQVGVNDILMLIFHAGHQRQIDTNSLRNYKQRQIYLGMFFSSISKLKGPSYLASFRRCAI